MVLGAALGVAGPLWGADDRSIRQTYDSARALAEAGRTAESIAGYKAVLALDWDYVPALDDLAWIRATCADGQFRNGAEAERLATHLVELAQYRFRAVTGGEFSRAFKIHASQTLAAAYAANGNFSGAVGYAIQSLETAERLNELSPSEMAAQLVADAKKYLKTYRSGAIFLSPTGFPRTPVPLR